MTDDILVRQARPGDGPALEEAVEQINNETEFLGVPGEGHPWDGRFEEELARLDEQRSGVMLVALDGEAIIGYLSAFAGWYERHRGNVFIATVGLLERYRGLGIGTRLFAAIEDWARGQGGWRLELRVSSLNERGQGLYRKCGFANEGTIRAGVLRGGVWTDDFWMGKLLAPATPRMPVPDASLRPSGRHATHTLVLRELRPGDGPAFRDWETRLCATTPLALKLPGEVAPVDAIERDFAATSDDPRLWLAAVQQDMYGPEAIIGFATASIERRFRMASDAWVGVNVLPEWAGQGLGRRLHARLEAWARAQGVRRLSAALQAPNRHARAFAATMGYEEEVTMRGMSRIDGLLVDRVRVGKLLV
ncbi:MAG TPA: GNAT family N-acetyltransferase [Stellaceae bacterium]